MTKMKPLNDKETALFESIKNLTTAVDLMFQTLDGKFMTNEDHTNMGEVDRLVKLADAKLKYFTQLKAEE